jgi:hypothetical protein
MPQESTGWTLVLSESFTTTLDTTMWSAIDNDGATNGEYYWATGIYSNTGVTNTLARAISGGANGISVTASTGYTDSVDSWLILGPFNPGSASAAVVTFDYWFDATVGDYFGVAVSTDGGLTYSGERLNGGLEGWHSVSYNLNDVVGETAVYIAFIFTSDDSGNTQNRMGAYLDNINLYMRYSLSTYLPLIRKDFTPTPTATPIATNTPIATPVVPVAHYLDNFDNANSGWAMRRTDITNANNWGVVYTNQQELQIEVDNPQSYVIAAPVALAPQRPYNIEVKARFTTDSENQHKYGIVFAGDWDGHPCVNNNYATCFNKYYLLQVQIKFVNNVSHLEYIIRQVYDHDANNNPIFVDLKGWTTLTNAAPTGWHEWDVFVDDDGTIRIAFEDTQIASVTGSTGLDRPYFGVLGSTSGDGNAVVRFDYYKVDEVR